MSAAPTIVLVHGAFADATSWAPVTRELVDRGHTVIVPPVCNCSLVADAASIRAVAEHVDGCAAITVAGVASNGVGLVYVSGDMLDGGDNRGQLQDGFRDSDLAANLVSTPCPSRVPRTMRTSR